MTDTQYKPTIPRSRPTTANSRRLSHPSAFKRGPVAAAAYAQSNVLSGYRTIFAHHTGGPAAFQVSNATPSLLVSPDFFTWRTLRTVRESTTPGTVLVARCISSPCGAKYLVDPGGDESAVGGEARLLFTWTNEAGVTATKTAQLELAPASAEVDGVENQADGAAWAQLHHSVVPVIRPDGAANDPEIRERWSEANTVEIELQVRGGARIVYLGVAEAPLEHAALHDADAPSATGVGSDLAWDGSIPKTSAPDGATFEERRFGINQALRVAGRQTTVLGPAIARWGSYTSDGTLPTASEPTPAVITASGATTGPTPAMQRISASTVAVLWARNSPGWWIMGVGQQPDARRQQGRGPRTYSTLRVRARVRCRFASVGAGVGLIRWQTTDRSWIQIRPDRAVIGDTWTWLTITGTVEANVSSDDAIAGAPYATVQDFASRGTATANLEITAWDLTYGHYPQPS